MLELKETVAEAYGVKTEILLKQSSDHVCYFERKYLLECLNIHSRFKRNQAF